MQNKAKFRKSQMNVNKVLTKNYEQMDTWSSGKNEPKTNPTCRGVASGEAGTNPIKANKMPKQTQYKAKQSQPVVSLPALPVLSAVEGSAVEGVEPISKSKKCCSPPFCCGISYRDYYVVQEFIWKMSVKGYTCIVPCNMVK